MAKSVNAVELALAAIDEDIASLQRSRDILVRAAASVTDAPEQPKVRKPRKKKGLPADADI